MPRMPMNLIIIVPYEQDPEQAAYAERIARPLEVTNSLGSRRSRGDRE